MPAVDRIVGSALAELGGGGLGGGWGAVCTYRLMSWLSGWRRDPADPIHWL